MGRFMEAVPQSTWAEQVRWFLRSRWRFRVAGESMLPVLSPGDEVLIDPHAYTRRSPRPGEIVVARHPYRTGVRMIKRVRSVRPDGRCELAGDNPSESTDSRGLGAVSPQAIVGKVTGRLP